MLELNKETKLIIGETLVHYYICNIEAPVIITFCPAGSILTSREVQAGNSGWSFDFFKKNKINIISFTAIDCKHWFLCDKLLQFIKELSPQLNVFPERLGYGASMGAFSTSIYASELQLNRLLLITPIRSPKTEWNEQSKFNYCANFKGDITIVYDPFSAKDKQAALSYPNSTHYLKIYGVGHRVIESLSEIKLLKQVVLQFVNNKIDHLEFVKVARRRRNLERYYSYIARNPTHKNTPRRKKIIRYYLLQWNLKHPKQIFLKLKKKWSKSLTKKINKFIK